MNILEMYELYTSPENNRRLDAARQALRAAGATDEQIREYGGALTVAVLDVIERKIDERPA